MQGSPAEGAIFGWFDGVRGQGEGNRQEAGLDWTGLSLACSCAVDYEMPGPFLQELGLPVNPAAPLLGFIGRLDMQKGVDLIADNYEWLMSEGAQLVLLGSGRPDLESALR